VRSINSNISPKIAEVIEASTAQFIAQCYELYPSKEGPPLGGLVKTGDIYGVVCNAETSGMEPGRRPIARGREEASEEAVYRASPQLSRLLRSEFTAAVVGFKDGDKLYQYLPPQPARIHSFVYLCQPGENKEFSRSFDFLQILLSTSLLIPPEELIAAALRQMSKAQDEPRAFLVAAGKELADLLSNDYMRLRNILGRLV